MNLDDRMKSYEDVNRSFLPRRLPMIIRVDGRAFHTLTKKFKEPNKSDADFYTYFGKPFDDRFQATMHWTMQALAEEAQGTVFGFTQSDEISLLVRDDQTYETEPWFGKNIQKIVSVAASICTREFNMRSNTFATKLAEFDARAFVLPPEEVVNYFIWRQQDATRNSIQGYCQEKIGDRWGKKTARKLLHGKKTAEQQELLFKETGLNWNDLPPRWKRGFCLFRDTLGWRGDNDLPIFTQDRDYINKFML